jgi:hypothetical protein
MKPCANIAGKMIDVINASNSRSIYSYHLLADRIVVVSSETCRLRSINIAEERFFWPKESILCGGL